MKLHHWQILLGALGVCLAVSLAFSGCSWFSVKVPDVPTVIKPDVKPDATKPSVKPRSVEDAEKELAEAKEAKVKAYQLVEQKEKALKEILVISRQHKLYWLVGIAFLAMLGCVAGAIFLSSLAKYFVAGAVASAAIALLCLLVAAVLPYMPYILLGFGSVGAIVLFLWWRLDHKSLQQVATAVETYKDKMPDYKEHFRQVIDGEADAWLNRVRAKLNVKKTAKIKSA